MPAWEARSPRAGPDLEAVLAGRLPESEVPWMALARIDLAPSPCEQLVGGVARKLAVGGEARDVVVDGAADLVGVTHFDQLRDEVDHLRDVLSSPRIGRCRPDVHARRSEERRVGE